MDKKLIEGLKAKAMACTTSYEAEGLYDSAPGVLKLVGSTKLDGVSWLELKRQQKRGHVLP